MAAKPLISPAPPREQHHSPDRESLASQAIAWLARLKALALALRGARYDSRTWVCLLCDQLLVSGTNFLTTVVVGRVLGKSQLGMYVLAYSLIVVLIEVQNSFIASPYTMNSPRLDERGQAQYTGDGIILSCGLAALAAVVLLAAATLLPDALGLRDLRPLLLIFPVVTPPLLVKEFGRRVCFAHFHVRQVLLIDIVVSAVQFTGLFLATRFATPSVRTVYLLVAAASASAAVLWMVASRSRIVVVPRSAFERLRHTWSFGMWVLTGNLAFVLPQQLYPWFLASLKGSGSTGAFAACVGLLALVNPLVSAVGNYLGPATANASLRGPRELSRVILQWTMLLSGTLGLFSLGTVFLGNRILLVLYGSEYQIDGHVLAVLAASLFVSQATLALGFGFWAIDRPDMNLKINLVALLVSVCLGPWLVSRYGLLGAAYGLCSANASVSLVRIFLLRRMLLKRMLQHG